MKFRLGVIGTGGMGSVHIKNITSRLSDLIEITALCDIDPDHMLANKHLFKEGEVAFFEDSNDLIHSGLVDGVLIATPHYDHPTIAMEAFKAGLHVFCEKPVGVYTKNIRELYEVAKKNGTTFQVNFVMRSTPPYAKIKELIDDDRIGTPRRLTWVITTWYRTQTYYNSGGWRATWAGEGGGTLLNQNPHQLDLVQWFIGVPDRIRGFCYFGKRRDIEVEDEATIYMEYKNGLTATYITSVTEFPGTNRLEIAGNKGKIVYENDKITLTSYDITEEDYNATTTCPWGDIEYKTEEFSVPFDVNEGQIAMVKNFVLAAQNKEKLISPGFEGINSLSISNAAYLSSWTDNWVELPIDDDKFLEELNKRIETSTYVKKTVTDKIVDARGTYTK